MPRYTVRAPDGRLVTLTGDAPPTEADLDDIFSQIGPRKPAAAEDYLDTSGQPQGSAIGRFFSNAGEMLNPVAAVKGIYGALSAPGRPEDAFLGPLAGAAGLIRGAVGSQVGEGQRALDLAKGGRYVEAAGHGLAALTPLVGPAAAAAGEQIAEGDVAGGLGKGAGLLAPMALGAALPKSVKAPAIAPSVPEAAEALALAEREGIPLDAATATGNRFVKAAQHVSDRSLGGSLVAGKAAQAQAEGLATLGEQLAAKGFAVPISAEEAGAGVSDAVRGVMRGHAADADAAYGRLRELVADPKHLTTIEPPAAVAGEMFPGTSPRATIEDIFRSALAEARKQGYDGTVGDLRRTFNERIASARDLRAASAEGAEYSPQELLRSIRELGGIRPFDKEFTVGAPEAKLAGEYDSLRQQYANQRGASAILRKDGLAIDDMLDQLRQDPRWKQVLTDDTEAFKSMLGEVSDARPAPSDLQHYLRGVGVHPAAKWWAETGPQQIPMAVDLRAAKDALKPMHAELERQAKLTPASMQGDKAVAYRAIDKIVNGPDHASLPDVDAALGELKSFARVDDPALRTIGQGKVAAAVKQLDGLVRRTAADAGPEVLKALESGRQSTIAKYGAQGVMDLLHAEPVRTVRALTAPGDTGIERLRAVAAQAPEALPAVGRAKLGELLEMSPDKRFAEWRKMGAATKQLLYQDPGYVNDLDAFMRLVKMTAETSNPSGTAHTLLVAGQGGLLFTNPIAGVSSVLGTAALSKFLHSSAGVRLLTRGMRIPVANKAASAAWLTELAAATNPSGSQSLTGAPAR